MKHSDSIALVVKPKYQSPSSTLYAERLKRSRAQMQVHLDRYDMYPDDEDSQVCRKALEYLSSLSPEAPSVPPSGTPRLRLVKRPR